MNLQQEIEAEKLRSSLESAQFGIASVQLEGLDISAQWQKRLSERAVQGEFGSEAFVQEVVSGVSSR